MLVIDIPDVRSQHINMRTNLPRIRRSRPSGRLALRASRIKGPLILTQEVVSMKRYGFSGLVLAVCLLFVAWPLLASAQQPAGQGPAGTEGKDQMKGSAGGPEGSKGKMETYKKDLQKELRAMDNKIAALGKKVKTQGDKAGAEAKDSWNDLKAKQKTAKGKLKALSSKAWDKTKAEADAARDELQKAYDKAASYFK